jgi:hypothetical protein
VGLGGGPGEWDDFEWVSLSDLPVEPLAEALLEWLADHPVWTDPRLERVLLVDLDNLRADPVRWRIRMAAMLALARQADHAHFAGQRGAVRRARPYLDELAETLQEVPDGSDLADHALLEAASELDAAGTQVTVVSNDGIFAGLAEDGPLTVVSPGRDALSNALRRAATRVIDLSSLEEAAAGAAEGAY